MSPFVPEKVITSFLIRNTTEVVILFVKILFMMYSSLQRGNLAYQVYSVLYSCAAKGQCHSTIEDCGICC